MWSNITKQTEYIINGGAVENPKMLRKFFEDNNIVKFSQIPKDQDWERFLSTGKNTSNLSDFRKYKIPYNDHGRAFKTQSGEVCFISQPYQKKEDVILELKEWVVNKNIEFEIYDTTHSWYSSTLTTSVIVLHSPGVHFIVS